MGWWQQLFGGGKRADGDEDRLALVQRLLAAAQAATNAEATTTTADVLGHTSSRRFGRRLPRSKRASTSSAKEPSTRTTSFTGVQACPVMLSATEDTLAHFAALEKAAMEHAREVGRPGAGERGPG